jgi:hypothetical protein
VASELVVGFIVEPSDGRLLEGAVHALDLPVGPRVSRFGQAMVDVVFGAGILEGMCPKELATIHCQPDVGSG